MNRFPRSWSSKRRKSTISPPVPSADHSTLVSRKYTSQSRMQVCLSAFLFPCSDEVGFAIVAGIPGKTGLRPTRTSRRRLREGQTDYRSRVIGQRKMAEFIGGKPPRVSCVARSFHITGHYLAKKIDQDVVIACALLVVGNNALKNAEPIRSFHY